MIYRYSRIILISKKKWEINGEIEDDYFINFPKFEVCENGCATMTGMMQNEPQKNGWLMEWFMALGFPY